MTSTVKPSTISMHWEKIAGAGALLLAAYVANTAKQLEVYKEPFSISDQSQTYDLISPNKVVISDGSGLTHTVDFRNQVVATGSVQRISRGGSGYGGITSFQEFNQQSLADAKKAGCDITEIIAGHKPSMAYEMLSYSSAFDRHLSMANAFKAQFCM